MRVIGDWIARGGTNIVSAMDGYRSPWGSGENGNRENGTGPAGDADEGTPATHAANEAEPPEGGSGEGPPQGSGPRNPWLPPGESQPRRGGIEDIFRGRGGGQKPGGGPGGGPGPNLRGPFSLPPRPDGKSWLPLIFGGIAAVWLIATSSHQLGSTEEGIVTTFGSYSHTIGPGVSFTLPWPIQDVEVTDVTSIRRDSIPEGEAEKLMLTSDQSLVDLSYIVRWNIKNLKLYAFQLDDPDSTVREVAEAAMRASVAEVDLTDVMGGTGRAEIENNVRQRMQAILDTYHAGVLIQGVDIKKADPPSKVNDAFQKVSAAQQDANRDLSNAQAFAQQTIARAQGEATSFDKIYAQYKLAPEVTRRRMYYETMERVLSANDKVIAPSNTISYLPLPELHRRAADSADAQSTGGQ